MGALEGLFSSVSTLVLGKTAVLSEALLACITFVWLLSCVNSDVTFEVGK